MLSGNRIWIWGVVAAMGLVAGGCEQAEEPPEVEAEVEHEHGHDHDHDHDHEGEDAGASNDDGADEPAADPDDGVARITIEGNDAMQYNIDSFTVEAGQRVELTLEHVGQQPAQAMGHNVVILMQDEDPVDFGMQVMSQDGYADEDYVPESMREGRVLAFTAMVGGGQSDTIEFDAPDEPGEYPFVCTFPGHPRMMNGVMIVE